jgi:hypothetical protein
MDRSPYGRVFGWLARSAAEEQLRTQEALLKARREAAERATESKAQRVATLDEARTTSCPDKAGGTDVDDVDNNDTDDDEVDDGDDDVGDDDSSTGEGGWREVGPSAAALASAAASRAQAVSLTVIATELGYTPRASDDDGYVVVEEDD